MKTSKVTKSAKGVLTSLATGKRARKTEKQKKAKAQEPSGTADARRRDVPGAPTEMRIVDSQRGAVKEAPSTLSTPSTAEDLVETVEGVEGESNKPIYDWYKDTPLNANFLNVGRCLTKLVLGLYRHADEGLVLVEGRAHALNLR